MDAVSANRRSVRVADTEVLSDKNTSDNPYVRTAIVAPAASSAEG